MEEEKITNKIPDVEIKKLILAPPSRWHVAGLIQFTQCTYIIYAPEDTVKQWNWDGALSSLENLT